MKTILITVLFVIFYPGSASAYLDAGNGSYVFQILLGLFFTVIISLKMAWGNAMLFLRNLFRGRSKVEPDK